MLRGFQIILNKLLTWICQLFHKNGSVFPGSITYNINQSILEKIKYPKYVIGVTGSSGKGSTTKLIYHILKEAGIDVVYNSSESNGIRAITTLILNNCTITGKFKHDVLLLELDEKHLHLAFKKNKMTHLVLTNITRDQPTRNSAPNLVIKSIMDALDDSTTLIINADDPSLKKAILNRKNKIVTYGLNKYADSITKPTSYSIDNAYCPKCHHKLNYTYYHYGHLGNYHCPHCDFNRNPVMYEGTKIDLVNQTMVINKQKVKIEKQFIYTAYATIAAYSLCKSLNIPEKTIIKALNTPYEDNSNTREYNLTLNNRPLMMLISKNENSLSYFQSLQYIKNIKANKCVIIGFENVSRRYKINDMSWLWDIDFELLNDEYITQIILVGRFKYNVATRLKYANISPSKFIFINDDKEILNVLKEKTTGNIYTIVGFEMTKTILHLLEEENKEETC